MKKKTRVFIISKSIHDYSAAQQYGQFVYLSENMMNRYATNQIFRQFYHYLKHAKPDDWILITGLNTMNIIACVIFALKHQRLNLLIHSPEKNNYTKRNMDFSTIL